MAVGVVTCCMASAAACLSAMVCESVSLGMAPATAIAVEFAFLAVTAGYALLAARICR